SNDAGVIDQNVDAAPTPKDLLHHLRHFLVISDVGAVRDCLASRCRNFSNNRLSTFTGAASPIQIRSQIVDNYLRAATCQRQRIVTSEATATPRNDRNPVVEPNMHD